MTQQRQLPPHRFTGRRQDGTTARPGDVCQLCGIIRSEHDKQYAAPAHASAPPPINWETVQVLKSGDMLLLFVNDPAGNLGRAEAGAWQSRLRRLIPGIKFQLIIGAQAVIVRHDELIEPFDEEEGFQEYKPLAGAVPLTDD